MQDINSSIVGVDLGGTNVRVGKITNEKIERIFSNKISANCSKEVIVNEVIHAIDQVIDNTVLGIGIGVPSVVDTEKGIVYDVQNIPSWDEVHLRDILQAKYKIPVFVNNDANCFVAGEKYFGHGKGYRNIVGLIMGTGFGSGLYIDNRLYAGSNCGSGEFGMIPYKEHNFEYYCSGQYFQNVHGVRGEDVFTSAQNNDLAAQKIFDELGYHIGQACNTVLYTIDPEIIILGGSVSRSSMYFEKSMHSVINTFPYRRTIENLNIVVSTIPNIAVLGAAALYLEGVGANVQTGLSEFLSKSLYTV